MRGNYTPHYFPFAISPFYPSFSFLFYVLSSFLFFPFGLSSWMKPNVCDQMNGVCMSPTASNSNVGLPGSLPSTTGSNAAAVARTKALASASTELKRSRSQGTRKLQMMHTIHQSMMSMPSHASSTYSSDHNHYEPERLINSSSINQFGHHHLFHHGGGTG